MLKRPLFRFILIAACCMLLLLSALPQASAQIETTIRVYLKRLKVEDTLRIQVNGVYMLEGGSMVFRDGAELAVTLRNNQLVLHTGQAAIAMGAKMKLIRCDSDNGSSLILNESDGLYEGDLALDIADDAIRPILHIYIEDYLLGVVPYEMGDSFPLEALKAQAIAARTYALKKSGSDGAYDVEDTTNDQAYKGRSSSHPVSEQAVRETEGLCGTYKGELAQCFYSASNGGQTELGQHVWPSENPDEYGYMDMRDDPYDYENNASSVKRYTLSKKPGAKGVGTALHSALTDALTDPLAVLGYAAESDLVRFDEITRLELSTPKFSEPSRLMTEMLFSVKISVRECLYRDQAQAVTQDESAALAADATPEPTATPAYSPYTRLDQVFTVTLPIFTEVEKAMGLSINVYQNELISILDIGTAYMIESRRFGHGVGMSQRGAQQMAKEYGMTYDQILDFYYPGLELMACTLERLPLPTADAHLLSTPAPAASPTPRPTLMPVGTQEMPEGAYIAVVTNIEEDSSLNLREYPSLSAEVKRRLYKDQPLLVLSSTSDGWSHVKTDVIEGYVRTEYLQTAEEK